MKTKLLLLLSLFVLQSNAQCWDKISSGAYHTIAIAHDGTLWAWGYNANGQVGNLSNISTASPVKISTDTDWVTIGTGHYHSFAIKSNGTLWGWGYNAFGQLGNGQTSDRIIPTQIGTETNWLKITGGEEFTVAIKTDGTLWSWGKNQYGQLGIGSVTSQTLPVQIGSDNNWSQIATGRYHAYALKTTKKLWAWGLNNYSQIGDLTTTNRTSPVAIATATNYDYITAGVDSGIAIKEDGFLNAWGLVDAVNVYANYPFNYLSTLGSWTNIKAGQRHFIGTRLVSGNNLFYTWGRYPYFPNGTVNTTIATNTPTQFLNTEVISNQLSVNLNSSLVLNNNGLLYGVGQNHVGQLGNSNGSVIGTSFYASVACPAVLSSESFDSQNTISLYPNPVSNQLNVSTNSEIQKLVIYDVTGKQVKYQEENTNSIDVEDLKSGFYLLEITIDGNKEIRKFLKQ